MAAYPECSRETEPTKLGNPRVYRVIDDGTCILTTFDAAKALRLLGKTLDKYEISHCWVDEEEVK